MPLPEPWLRGPLDGVPLFLQPLFFSFRQVREDVAHFTEGLTEEQVWRIVGNTSIGFHLKHMAGSVDRLTTYLFEKPLSTTQLETLHREQTPDLPLQTLLQQLYTTLDLTEGRLLGLPPDQLFAPRTVGRQHLPTSVLGLLVHIAEHTQRHLGQVIASADAVRQQV